MNCFNISLAAGVELTVKKIGRKYHLSIHGKEYAMVYAFRGRWRSKDKIAPELVGMIGQAIENYMA